MLTLFYVIFCTLSSCCYAFSCCPYLAIRFRVLFHFILSRSSICNFLSKKNFCWSFFEDFAVFDVKYSHSTNIIWRISSKGREREKLTFKNYKCISADMCLAILNQCCVCMIQDEVCSVLCACILLLSNSRRINADVSMFTYQKVYPTAKVTVWSPKRKRKRQINGMMHKMYCILTNRNWTWIENSSRSGGDSEDEDEDERVYRSEKLKYSMTVIHIHGFI